METRIKRLENIAFLLIIPLLFTLPLIEGKFRNSISDYVYSDVSLLFSVILTFAGTILIVNGCNDDIHLKNKWYAFIQGGLLIGVVLTPHLDYELLHYTFAGLFFIGSVFEMIFWCSAKYRLTMFFLAFSILTAMFFHFVTKSYSLFWAEIIGLTPIIINKLGENNNKLN